MRFPARHFLTLLALRVGSTWRQRGFTLIELLVVIAVIGILAAVALPAYQQHVIKGRRADAVTALTQILQTQERRRSNNASYTDDFAALGITVRPGVPTTSPAGHYILSIEGLGARPSLIAGFTVYARPVSTGLQASDTDCAEMAIQVQRGNIYYLALNSADANSSAKCWPK